MGKLRPLISGSRRRRSQIRIYQVLSALCSGSQFCLIRCHNHLMLESKASHGPPRVLKILVNSELAKYNTNMCSIWTELKDSFSLFSPMFNMCAYAPLNNFRPAELIIRRERACVLRNRESHLQCLENSCTRNFLVIKFYNILNLMTEKILDTKIFDTENSVPRNHRETEERIQREKLERVGPE